MRVEAAVGGDVRFARVLFVVVVEVGDGRHPVLLGGRRPDELAGEGHPAAAGAGSPGSASPRSSAPPAWSALRARLASPRSSSRLRATPPRWRPEPTRVASPWFWHPIRPVCTPSRHKPVHLTEV